MKKHCLFLLMLFCGYFPGLYAQQRGVVSLVVEGRMGAPAEHGLAKLTEALRSKGILVERVGVDGAVRGSVVVVAGLAGAGGAAESAQSAGRRDRAGDARVLDSVEGLQIKKTTYRGKKGWLVSGHDDRGLMYALLDMADRIGWSGAGPDLFGRVREAAESADVKERGVVIYTMNRAYWESRFYDTVYWSRYLDMMAADRLNMLEVGFGFENGGFLAPAYPYFFNTPGWDNIRMGDITAEQQAKNLAAFNTLIRMCHDRGIGFRVGFWDHIYRAGYQSNKDMPDQVNSQVQGVTADNMIPYTKAALARFIDLVPELDGILFRAHDESGLKKGEQLTFWKAIFDTLAVKAPKLVVDLHAKEVSDTIVHEGQQRGLSIRMSTKYWMEQMGYPFHPTHTNRITDNSYRRHGYADMLNYEEHYPVFYRIWGGTTRVLLWGDPVYARRFAASTHIHDGVGFGVNEPLTTKMHAQPHDGKVFELLKPAYRYYDFEFQRYWHFYQTFGRIGYNPATASEVWDETFRQHFGVAAGRVVEEGLHRASWVVPRIVASCFPLVGFPIASGWAEKQHMEDLPVYAATTPSDVQQFASFDDEARLLMEKGETAKLLPSGNSRWFKMRSEEIMRLVRAAERVGGSSGTGSAGGAGKGGKGGRSEKELFSTLTDLKIIAGLALYHSRRIPAAVSYRLYERTRDAEALDEAIRYEKDAIEAWKTIVDAAGDVYADTLKMGPRRRTLTGHWRQELEALQAGLAKLERLRQDYVRPDSAKAAPKYAAVKEPAGAAGARGVTVVHQRPERATPGASLNLTAKVKVPAGVKWINVLYRDVHQYKEFTTIKMQATGKPDEFSATIPGDAISAKWDLMYLIEVMDKDGHGAIYPDLDQETPYVVVKVKH